MSNKPHETTWDKIVDNYIYVPGILLVVFIATAIITAVSGADNLIASALGVLFLISILPIILFYGFLFIVVLIRLILKKDFWISVILNLLIMVGIPVAIAGIVFLIIHLTI